MPEQNNAINSLAHTKWNCKYHIVFAPKYRRKVFFGEKREAIREILRTLCQWKGVEISMPRSHPFTGRYSAQDKRIGIHGVSKREKQLNDIPEVREYEICISEQGILVQRVLCGYGREEHKSDKRVHREPAKGR